MEHLLGGDVQDHPPPTGDRIQLLVCQPFIELLLERERREQVLTHDSVLELGGLTEHVNQCLAMLDHERRLGRGLSAASRENLGEPPSSRAWRRLASVSHYDSHYLKVDMAS